MKRRITFDEFLKLLPKTGWMITSYGSIIRADKPKEMICPWVYVSTLPGVSIDISVYSGRIDKRIALFNAADGVGHHHPEIRRRLLEACGLKERKTHA